MHSSWFTKSTPFARFPHFLRPPSSVVLSCWNDHQPKVFPQNRIHRHTFPIGLICTNHADSNTRGRLYVSLTPLHSVDYILKNHRENLNYEREIVVPKGQQDSHRMFGVTLDELMGPDGEFSTVPPVIRDCVAYLRLQGLSEQGLFRRSPSTTILRQLEEAYDRGQRVDIAHYDDPHLAAVLIKKFFRMLPQSIFSEDMYGVIRKCPVPDDEGTRATSIEYVREEVIGGLPGNAQILLNVVIRMWTPFPHTAPRIHFTASRTPSRSLKKFSQEPHGRPQPCRSLHPQPRIQCQPPP